MSVEIQIAAQKAAEAIRGLVDCEGAWIDKKKELIEELEATTLVEFLTWFEGESEEDLDEDDEDEDEDFDDDDDWDDDDEYDFDSDPGHAGQQYADD